MRWEPQEDQSDEHHPLEFDPRGDSLRDEYGSPKARKKPHLKPGV